MRLPKTAAKHHANVRALGCIISNRPSPTIHHCHGGSMKQRGWHVGMGQKQNEALVIPLNALYHTGVNGIDSGVGVGTWERTFGDQADFLDEVSAKLGYDVWLLAELWRPAKEKLRAE